jgi:hypothetical protein
MSHSPIRSGSSGRCPRNSVPHANHPAAHPVSPPLGRPATAPALPRVPAPPTPRWATPRSIARRVTLRSAARWAPARPTTLRRRQRTSRFGWASPQLMRWCRCSTGQSRCARLPNSAQPQSVGLPSKRDVVRRSNWFGSQPNSAPPQTSNLTRNQPLRPTKLLMKPDPLMTYLPRILMTNWTSTTNQTTNQKNWCQTVRRTPPPACSPRRLRRRAQTLERPRGQCAAPSPAKRSGDNRRGHQRSVHLSRHDRRVGILHL